MIAHLFATLSAQIFVAGILVVEVLVWFVVSPAGPAAVTRRISSVGVVYFVAVFFDA